MVLHWSPEPCDEVEDLGLMPTNDDIIFLGEEVIIDNVAADDIIGYELLSADTPGFAILSSGENTDDDQPSPTLEPPPQEVPQAPSSSNSVDDSSSLKVIPSEHSERSDIEVNCDAVREAMTRVTLPPSAYPPWASNVPESQWSSFLITRMNDIQNSRNAK